MPIRTIIDALETYDDDEATFRVALLRLQVTKQQRLSSLAKLIDAALEESRDMHLTKVNGLLLGSIRQINLILEKVQ
jgi:uncharacterized membrane protein